MYKKYIVILLLLAGSIANAQILNHDLMNLMDEVDRNKVLRGEHLLVEYKGSPYIPGEFVKGTVEFEDGKVFKDIPVRYNAYNDNFEVLYDGKEFALERSPRLCAFTINNRKFSFRTYLLDKGKQQQGYLEEIIGGKFSLYAKHNIIFEPPQAEAAYKDATPATFKTSRSDYLLGKEDGDIIKFKSAKEIIESYPELNEQIKEYSPKGKLKLRKEEDYVRLVNFLNKGTKNE